MINIISSGGLGNRIKPIVSSRLFPEHELRIHWHNVYMQQCRGREWLAPFIGDWNHYFKNQIPRCEARWDIAKNDNRVFPGANWYRDNWRFLKKNGEPNYDLTFNRDLFEVFQWLEPVDEVQRVLDTFRVPLLGIQVRSFHKDCEKIPVEKYISIAEKYTCPFLLVTDSEKIFDKFVYYFGERVVFYTKSWQHEDMMLDRSNLIEMLLLSRCSITYLSTGSTFGECAYYFSNGFMKPRFVS